MRNRVKVAFQLSLICVSFLIVFFLTIYFIDDIGALDMLQDMDFWVPAVFMFVGMKYFRDRYNNRELRFWEALSFGAMYMVFVSLLFSTFIYLFMSAETSYMSESITLFKTQQQFLQHKMDSLGLANDPQFEDKYKMVTERIAQSSMATPSSLALGKFIVLMGWGAIYTVIIGAINRR